MTYQEIVKALNTAYESDEYTIEIKEKATGKSGVASGCNEQHPGLVSVIYGADDGSDDKTITIEQFIADFEITKIIDER